MNRFTLFALLPLVTLTPSISSAQWRDPDTTVRALGAAPVSHHGNASSAVAVMHPNGDVVIAADGVLMADPEGRTRWHAPEPATTDVAVAPDGSVFGMARLPAERPVTLRIDAFDPDGTPRWSQTLHSRRVDPYTYPDMTTAPDGDVVVCSTVRRGRSTPVIIDRLGPGGAVRWSRAIVPHGECSAIATDATGAIYWAGHETAGGVTHALIERLDPSGNPVWRASYDANPLPGDLAIVGDALTVAGSFIGQIDLLPGTPVGSAFADGYETFVTRLDARTGDASWAWVGSNLCLSSIATRGSEVLVLEDGTMTRLASTGTEIDHREFGQVRSSEGLISMPTITATAILVDARGETIFVGGIPAPEYIAFDDYFLWSGQPYHGPNGAVIGRPGW